MCNHNENRKKVCVACGKKNVFGKSKPEKYIVNKTTEIQIQTHLNPNFSKLNPVFPIAICTTCRILLSERTIKGSIKPLPEMPKYENIVTTVD